MTQAGVDNSYYVSRAVHRHKGNVTDHFSYQKVKMTQEDVNALADVISN